MFTQEQETALKTRLARMSTQELKNYSHELLTKNMTNEDFFICDCVLNELNKRIKEQIATLS